MSLLTLLKYRSSVSATAISVGNTTMRFGNQLTTAIRMSQSKPELTTLRIENSPVTPLRSKN